MNKKTVDEFKQYDDDVIRLARLKTEIRKLKKAIADAEYITSDMEYKYQLLKDSGERFDNSCSQIYNDRISVKLTNEFGATTVLYEFRQYLVIDGYSGGFVQHFEEDSIALDKILEAPTSEHSSILAVVDGTESGLDAFIEKYKEFPYIFDVIYLGEIDESDLNIYADKLSQVSKLRKAQLGNIDVRNMKFLKELKAYDIVISEVPGEFDNIIDDRPGRWRKLMALMNNLSRLDVVFDYDQVWARGELFDSDSCANIFGNNKDLFKRRCRISAELVDKEFVFTRRDSMDEQERLNIDMVEARKDLLIAKLENEMKSLKNENNALRVANKAIKESYSWKITKPVRDFGSLFIGKDLKQSDSEN